MESKIEVSINSRGKQVSRKRKLIYTPYLFLLPALIVLGTVILFPILYSLVISFFRYQFNMPALGQQFIGIDNYVYIFQNQEILESIAWTLEFTVIVVSVELVLGLMLAVILDSGILGKMRQTLRAFFLLPIMLSSVVSGLIWRLLFDPEFGPVNHLTSMLGIGMVHWGSEAVTARLMVIITDIWLATPFCMLVLLAGMQGIPPDIKEAASIDGASSSQMFSNITLPLLKFPIMVVLVTRTMDAIRAFDMIYSLTNGGPGVKTSTIMYYIYRYGFKFFQTGRASAMAILFAILIFIISYFMMWFLRRESEY